MRSVYFAFICFCISLIILFFYIELANALPSENDIFSGISKSKIPFFLHDEFRGKILSTGAPQKYEFMPNGENYTENEYIKLKFPKNYIKQFPREIKKTEMVIEE